MEFVWYRLEAAFSPVIKIFHILFLSLVITLVVARVLQASTQVPGQSRAITAGNYRLFLSAVAEIQDVHSLYQPDMADQILCESSGNQKNYCIVDGQEDESMKNMTQLDAMRYCNWKENHCPNEKEDALAASLSTESGVYDLQDDQLVCFHSEAKYHLVDHGEESGFFGITKEPEEQRSSPLMMFSFSDGEKRESVSQEDRGNTEAARFRGGDNPSAGVQRGTNAGIEEDSRSAPERVPGETFCEMIKTKLLEIWNFLKRFFCERNEGEAALSTSINGVPQPAVARLAPIDRLSPADKESIENYIAGRMEKENNKSAPLSPDVIKDQIHTVLDSLVDDQVRSSSYFSRVKFAFFGAPREQMADKILSMQVIPALIGETQKMRNTSGMPIERASRASQSTIQAYIKWFMEIEGSASKSPEEAMTRRDEIEEKINFAIQQVSLEAKPAALEQLTPLSHQEKAENRLLQVLIHFLSLEMQIRKSIDLLNNLKNL